MLVHLLFHIVYQYGFSLFQGGKYLHHVGIHLALGGLETECVETTPSRSSPHVPEQSDHTFGAECHIRRTIIRQSVRIFIPSHQQMFEYGQARGANPTLLRQLGQLWSILLQSCLVIAWPIPTVVRIFYFQTNQMLRQHYDLRGGVVRSLCTCK